MATPVLNPKLTQAGLALFPNPTATGFAITLTHLAIGTALYAPTGSEVALKAEVARFPISSGTNPTTTSVQVGATITDTDPNGRSPNGLSIGEIGFFSNNTLVAVWSQLSAPLFVKSANFDVPFAYTLDISALPDSSVNITMATDPQGMAALILQHEAKTDPHSQYVQKVRGMGDYNAATTYPLGARAIGPDNKTYRSLADGNKGNTPSSSPSKWERWAFSLAELAAEFIPERTGIKTPADATADATGLVRVTNPAGAAISFEGNKTGTLKIAFPTGAQAKDSLFTMEIDLLQYADTSLACKIIVSAHTNALGWDTPTVTIVGTAAARDIPVYLGNDGTKPCIYIGALTTVWSSLRAWISSFSVSRNADGGSKTYWAAGWAMTIETALGTVTKTYASGNLVFAQSDTAHVAGLTDALNTKVSRDGSLAMSGFLDTPGLVLRSGGYSLVLRADASGLWGSINQAGNAWNLQMSDAGVLNLPRQRPTWAGLQPWDNGNLPDPLRLNQGRQTVTNNFTLSWGGAGAIAGITNSGQYAPVTIANGGNNGASSVIGFLRDGSYGAFFGLDVDNQWAVGGWSMGAIRYRIWHEGNFNPGSYVPIRNGNLGNGYVIANNNSIQLTWDGATYQMYTDNTYIGNMIHTNNFEGAWNAKGTRQWGIGTFLYSKYPQGGNKGYGNQYQISGLPGVWECRSNGSPLDEQIYVRVA